MPSVRPLSESLPGPLLIDAEVRADARGYFLEAWNRRAFAAAGLDIDWVQDNQSRSAPGVVRGMHWQIQAPQRKLVRVTQGAILDAVVDVRRGSPTFGRAVTVELTADVPRWLYVPRGFAHGFQVLTAPADVWYKVDAFWLPGDEYGFAWNDPAVAIPWRLPRPDCCSARDAALPQLVNVPPEHLPAAD